jgi:hypothetical protein
MTSIIKLLQNEEMAHDTEGMTSIIKLLHTDVDACHTLGILRHHYNL